MLCKSGPRNYGDELEVFEGQTCGGFVGGNLSLSIFNWVNRLKI